VGCSATLLSQVELGQRRPSRSLRRRLSQLYSVDAEQLFSDIEEAFRLLRRLGDERVEEVEKRA
jgi:transcriptional regulator with XRE-family HTH domain